MKSGLPHRARFSDRFTKDEDGCWRWKGSTDSKGYPTMHVKLKRWKRRRVVRVMRYVLALKDQIDGITYGMSEVEPIREEGIGHPEKDAHHICFERLCIRPAHGQWEDRKENRNHKRRSQSRG